MRPIDADEFEVVSYTNTVGYEDKFDDGVLFVLNKIDRAPTIGQKTDGQFMRIVICKDCINHNKCSVESTFEFAGIDKDIRFCCVGKVK